MISLTEPDPHILNKSKERPSQQTEREHKQKASSVFVPQLEERAHKSYDEEQRRADSTGDRQVCCVVQEFGPPAQTWNIGLEVGTGGIVVGDFIQTADAVDDGRHPTEQDRDEARHRAQHEGWCCRLRHNPRDLLCVRREIHMGAVSVRETPAYFAGGRGESVARLVATCHIEATRRRCNLNAIYQSPGGLL